MYVLTNAGVTRQSDNACIPSDTANADYQAFLEWQKEGNAPIPLKPSVFHNLTNNTWVLDTVAKAKADTENLKLQAQQTLKTNSENGFISSVRNIVMTYREIDCVRFTMSFIKNIVRDKNDVNHAVTETEFNTIKQEVLQKATAEQLLYWQTIDA